MGILPEQSCGIGILPMIHGLEAHATMDRLRKDLLIPDAPGGYDRETGNE
jgi:hypothetical protein